MTARLEDLVRGASVRGIDRADIVTVVDVRWFGTTAIELTFRRPAGEVANRLVYREDEPALEVVDGDRPWSLDGDGARFRLVAEAKRIAHAHLFDPFLAVGTSLIQPLPHQITAVYEEMLPRQPLRFLLADDPGAGKTIMTGMLIRELEVRGDVRRCLIVAPGSLAEQWQLELRDKFGLQFTILTPDRIVGSRSGNPFLDEHFLIARLDKLARDEALQAKLLATDWDLIVFDEAHRLSATVELGEVKKTRRRILAEHARGITRHYLLLTATPHNGKDEDFQLFLSLLDPDRFEGHRRRTRDAAVPIADTTDLMRRLMKEHLVKFDGTALFPGRQAHVVRYRLSADEAALYERVTAYVREEMSGADRLKQEGQGRRGAVVGFALTVLQRRLASSPEAIYQSLRRRRTRLEERRAAAVDGRGAEAPYDDPELERVGLDALEDLETADAPADEVERVEDRLVEMATAARTIAELDLEIETLRRLEADAARLRTLGTDRKWSELAALLADLPEMRDASGGRRKLVVFTEHRDTLAYLAARLRGVLGSDEAVVELHGGMPTERRRRQEAVFRTDPAAVVLVATDAAGEGINLQQAHLMVNYDLPWNPNRIEQRFGRIHRIGQTEVCHLWNLVADETREGEVYGTLLMKLEEAMRALGGEVFDVLGRVEFGDRSLRDLLVAAIREGDRPEVRAELDRVVAASLDHEHLRQLLRERELATEQLTATTVAQVREAVDRAAAHRLQPHFVGSLFIAAFRRLGGEAIEREPGRFELRLVPSVVRDNARHRDLRAVAARYERVVFDKALVAAPGLPTAEFVMPAHPLLDATLDAVLLADGALLRRGGRLVDRRDRSPVPRILLMLEHSIMDQRPTRDGRLRCVSQRLEFVELTPTGSVAAAGPAPFLDYEPVAPDEVDSVEAALRAAGWPHGQDLEERAVAYAVEHLAHRHLAEVRTRVEGRIERTTTAVKDRLQREIAYWSHRADELERRERASGAQALNSRRARDRAGELAERLQYRLEQLGRERQFVSQRPVVVGAALVVPQGLIDRIDGVVPDDDHAADAQRALEVVMRAERASGHDPEATTRSHVGYDILSRLPDRSFRFILVAPDAGSTSIEMPRTAALAARNVGAAYRIALVSLPDGRVRWAHPSLESAVSFDDARVRAHLEEVA